MLNQHLSGFTVYCGNKNFQHYSLLKAASEVKYKYVLRKEVGVFDEMHKMVCSHIFIGYFLCALQTRKVWIAWKN